MYVINIDLRKNTNARKQPKFFSLTITLVTYKTLCGLLVFYLVSIVPIFTVGITLLCFGMYPKYERSILISLNLTRVAYSLNDV